MTVNSKISPEIEFKTKDGYKWFAFSEKDTGLRLICLEDLKTKATLATSLANPKKRIAAHKAWAGARHSRAPGTPWEIMHEMGEKGVDPDQKLEMTFKNYGHASVGDMASIQIDITQIPIHFGYTLFNLSSINSGQEKSSRYQTRFGECVLHCLENYLPKSKFANWDEISKKYQGFGDLSLELYKKYKELIEKAFTAYYKPKDEAQSRSLNSRVLDCVRFFLLLGQDTGLSYETSARDWIRIIASLKASPLVFYQSVGNQIERLLTPKASEEKRLGYKAEAPSLIEFTQAETTTNENLFKLKKFILGKTDLSERVPVNSDFTGESVQKVELVGKKFDVAEKMVIQYLLAIWPGLSRKKLFSWVKAQKDGVRKRIGKIIFSGHNHHSQLSDLAATSEITLVIDGFYGETLRDFNRHRAWGRFGSLPLVHGLPIGRETMQQILAKGFGLPLYLTEVKAFNRLKRDFASDLENYYRRLYSFMNEIKGVSDFSFIINLLPMAQRCELFMHGNCKQAMYFTHLRTRNGGHINYRMLAYQANQLIADSDPYLEGLRLKKKPNPRSKIEFFDRS